MLLSFAPFTLAPLVIMPRVKRLCVLMLAHPGHCPECLAVPSRAVGYHSRPGLERL